MTTWTLTPAAKTVVNRFDYFGQLLGLPRLPAETNDLYRKRLWDVYVRRAGSNETGLINGITRELGLAQYDALTITSSSTTYPRVIVKSTSVDLYNKWRIDTDYTLETSIDIYSRDESYYLSDLVTAINATTYFTASLATGVDDHLQSAVLIPTDSRKWQDSEDINPFYRNVLEYGNIVDGSMQFSVEGRAVFSNEVDTEDDLLVGGDYYVDYTNGVVRSYSLPNKSITCRYMYDELPITVEASPVILYSFGDEYFRDKIFSQVLGADGEYLDGLPEAEAVSFISELLQVKGLLWGP